MLFWCVHYRTRCLAPSSLPQDRTKVCAILLQKLRYYEEQWRRAFDQGHDLDTLGFPSLTKEDFMAIIRQCPIKCASGWPNGAYTYCNTYLPYEGFRTEILSLRKRCKRPLKSLLISGEWGQGVSHRPI